MSSVITEDLGPRGRRRVHWATIASVAAGIALLAWVIWQFYSAGQFDPALWTEFIDFEFEWPQYLLSGLGWTLWAALSATVLSVAVGFALALLRITRSRVISWAARIYIDLVRTVPLVLLIFLTYLGLPEFGFELSAYWALVLALLIYHSAVLAEVFRAGIASLDRGQGEAASAIGLTYWQSMRIVILPQAVRRMIPAIVAQVATIVKDTSLGFFIGYSELLRRAEELGRFNPDNILQAYLVASLLYFIVIYFITRLARRLEGKQRKKYGAGRIEVAGGPEDLDAMGEEADEEEAAERNQQVPTSA